MIWTVLALALWVALGAFISYYGDLQGRRWGKRRVSLFHLRPKHTAILITSITGAVIALLSVVSICLVVPPVRDILLRGEAAINTNSRLEDEKRADLDKETRQIDDARAKSLAAERNLKIDEKTRAGLEHSISELNAKARELESEKSALLARKAGLESSIIAARSSIADLKAIGRKLDATNRHLANLNDDLGITNKELAQQSVFLSRENIELKHTNSDLISANNRLHLDTASENTAYQNLVDARSADEVRIKSENQRLTLENDALDHQKTTLLHDIDDLYGQMAGAQHDSMQAEISLRRGMLNFRAGAELARLTVDSHQRPEKIRSELAELLADASLTARKYGAVAGNNGREVQIVSKRLITASGVSDADEQASINALVDNLTGSDTPVVVMARAVNNTVEGERVFIELTPLTVTHLYRKGEVVATCQIDGSLPADAVIDALLQFLQKDVQDAAIRAGAIPRIDPESGKPEVGVAGFGDLFTLTGQVRRKGGMVTLVAKSHDDVTSADPLRLDFTIQRAPNRH